MKRSSKCSPNAAKPSPSRESSPGTPPANPGTPNTKNKPSVSLSYVIKNDQPSKPGQHTLLPGKVRIFIKTKEQAAQPEEEPGQGVAFTGQDWAALTPVDRESKLYPGQSRDFHLPSAQATGSEQTRLQDLAAAGYRELLRKYPDQPTFAAQALRSLGNICAARTNLTA